MKTYGFNLLPQKSRALASKENKRDSYSVAIAILPLTSVVIWLSLILINFFVVLPAKKNIELKIDNDKRYIETDLAPILISNGEMVTKTNALQDLIEKDIQPEQLFVLIDKIYSNQDPTFQITGYSRNPNGSFSVSLSAITYQRLAEITRRFSADSSITNVKLDSAVLDAKSNLVAGNISFIFTYQDGGTTTEQ
jgi:hypothetical protein